MSTETQKSSTILISLGGKTYVYRSLEEVPARLRRKLEQSTSGLNSGTILIADRGGREQILRSLRGLPSHVQTRLLSALLSRRRTARLRSHLASPWLQILLAGLAGLLLWLLVSLR